MPDPKTPSALALPPRGMNVIAAAKYMGVSRRTFLKPVRLGTAPAPLKLPKVDRNIDDREAIDRAMTARTMRHGGV